MPPRAGARPRRAQSGAPACAGLQQSPNPCGRRVVDLGRPERGASACRAAVVPDPRGQRAVDLGRPEQGARTCQAAAVPRPLRRARRRPRPARHPCRRGPALFSYFVNSSLSCLKFSLIGCKYVPSDMISKPTNSATNKAMKMIPIEPMVSAFLASAVGGSEGASCFGDEV